MRLPNVYGNLPAARTPRGHELQFELLLLCTLAYSLLQSQAPYFSVIGKIGSEVDAIYVVDDQCQENTGRCVEAECTDPRVRVVFNPANMGVGRAAMAG